MRLNANWHVAVPQFTVHLNEIVPARASKHAVVGMLVVIAISVGHVIAANFHTMTVRTARTEVVETLVVKIIFGAVSCGVLAAHQTDNDDYDDDGCKNTGDGY